MGDRWGAELPAKEKIVRVDSPKKKVVVTEMTTINDKITTKRKVVIYYPKK